MCGIAGIVGGKGLPELRATALQQFEPIRSMRKKHIPSVSVLINADDLDINSEVNDAIIDSLTRNQITSTTLLANGPGAKEAVALCCAMALPDAAQVSRNIATRYSVSGLACELRKQWQALKDVTRTSLNSCPVSY
jgi:hypothetical protein